MKRKLLHAVLLASMAVALSGCGNTSGINADAEETQKATETENIEEERGTEVAAAEQKENTTGTPDENGNYLINGSFEEPDFSGWTVTNNNDVTEELDVYDRETDCFAFIPPAVSYAFSRIPHCIFIQETIRWIFP